MSCGTRTRGTLTGLVAAAGAAWGHLWAGGLVTPAALATATVVSVVVGVALTRPDRLSPPRLVLATALVQALWHVLFTTSAPASAHHDMAHGAGTGTGMLGVHVLAGALALAVAVGADRAVLDLVRALVERLRVPAPATALPALRLHTVHPPRGVRPAGPERQVEEARGPPGVWHLTADAAATTTSPNPA